MAHTAPDELPPARYASAGVVSIAYQVIGAGPDVVLVSGLLNNIEASWQDPGFADNYRRIASFARLISFDKRGTGMSDRFPNDHSMGLDEHMDDIRDVMDAVAVSARCSWPRRMGSRRRLSSRRRSPRGSAV